jgi:hypothetical protein
VRIGIIIRCLLGGSLWIPLACPQAGLPPEWETRKQLSSLVANANRLDPVLSQLNPEAWKENGAPEAYVQQWQNTRKALSYLQISADRLAKDPNRVTFAMDTYFRLQSMEQLLGSLAAGVRRYQNPAIADLLMGIANENAANRDFLEQYLKDLAAARESELQVMDTEAQRCRSILSKQPRPAAKRPATAREAKE